MFTEQLHDVQRAGNRERVQRTWPARHPLRCIDHLFVTPDIDVEEVSVLRDDLARTASDHLPLVACLRIPD